MTQPLPTAWATVRDLDLAIAPSRVTAWADAVHAVSQDTWAIKSALTYYRNRYGPDAPIVRYLKDALSAAPTSTFTAPVSEAAAREALDTAETWAQHGYSDGSKEYWRGTRDTLRVLLGITTVKRVATGPGCDAAADALLGAQFRLSRR